MALVELLLVLALQDRAFLEKHCLDCHGADEPKGGLNLAALPFDPKDPKWITIHDRVRDGEMPPKKKPDRDALQAFLKSIAEPIAAADQRREATEGRSTWRRLNRYEYEHSLRDLLK